MNRLSDEHRAAIINALCEGNSIRATARLTSANKDTVMKRLVEAGEFASVYQNLTHRNLKTTRVEADEIWAFVGAKQRRAVRPGDGDIWTFTALDADSKLVISWLVGPRNQENFDDIMADLRSRLSQRIQLTADGHGAYLTAVRRAFKVGEVDYAQLVKQYGQVEQGVDSSRRYTPPVCTGTTKVRWIGRPDFDLISTSFVERSNLTLRMQSRRFTRLTNAFSKKAENHAHAVSLFFLHYNYSRPHQTLTKAAKGVKTTPAMAAGLTDRVWTVKDIVALMDPQTLLH